MINLIRADLYAIIRGKAIYITFGIMILLHILVIGIQAVGGINFAGLESFDLQVPERVFNGIGSAAILYTRTDNIVFFLLPLLLLAAAPLFTQCTVKNDIAWGISRTKLYLSKLTVAIGLCIFMIVFYMATGMALATVLFGWGGAVPDGYWLNLFQTVGAQLFMMIALSCFGVFLIFTTKSSSTVSGIYLAFCLVPAIIMMMLMDAGINVLRLLEFDIMLGINRLGFLSQLEARTIFTILGVGALYMVVTTIAGIALFRKAEIK